MTPEVRYRVGRAAPNATNGTTRAEPLQSTYQLAAHLAYTWAPTVDDRLDSIDTVLFDLADRVHTLGRMVAVAMCTTIACVGVLIAAALLVR